MKKFAFFIVCFAIFLAACSDNGNSSSSNEESVVTSEDSTKVIVYSYDKFLSKKDISILDDDTTKISVNIDLVNKVDSVLPQKGNVVVVWESAKKIPYYLRVVSVAQDSDQVTLDVDKATVFDAIPNGDFNLSSEVFVNTEALSENSNGEIELGDSAFFDPDENCFHPIIISELDENESDDNSEPLEYTKLSTTAYEKAFEKQGYFDVREAVSENFNWGKDVRVIHMDYQFTPGAVRIPGIGTNFLDSAQLWFDVFKNAFGDSADAESALKNANKLNAGKDTNFVNNTNAYIRVDTLRYANDESVHIRIKTSWAKLVLFELLDYSNSKFEVSNIGLGLGTKVSGSKNLTNTKGYTFVFSIFGVPIVITAKMDLIFKYNLETLAMFNYPLQYKYTVNDTTGFTWDNKNGGKNVKKEHHETTYNKSTSLSDFASKAHLIVDGNADIGLYPTASLIFYGAGGPKLSIGARLKLSAEISSSCALFNPDGTWADADPTGYVKLDFDIPLSISGELKIFKKKLTVPAYNDVLKKWNLFELNTDSL